MRPEPTRTPSLVAEVLAGVAYGERLGAERARRAVALAPDGRARTEQQHVADRERENCELIEARLRELGEPALMERFRPYFDAFFSRTEPEDWVEAQAFHYVGDALVSDFADFVAPLVDRVSAEVLRRALGEREELEEYALEELTRAIREDPSAAGRVRRYTQRVLGEALTQTARALERTEGLRTLLGGEEAGKRFLLGLLERHRRRLDRLGIDPVEAEEAEEAE
ncbi:MAG TPA: ferritin-like fold-containing protein [Actinomycetota bacterium]|nr:ferritin-like fold-containing protein [Actinomycetota bacterium]